MNQFYKNLALWLVIGMIMIALFNIFNQPLNNQSDVIFSEFMDQVESGKISEVTIQETASAVNIQMEVLFRQ